MRRRGPVTTTVFPAMSTETELAISYPPELPISQRRDDLLAAIAEHQVLVVAGETGSGKSTQLPKLCLELGRGRDALIGHTQPRRIAARTIAERIASELDEPLGDTVGYTVRFSDRVGASTRLRLMTDGILLAEIPRDRNLDRYDTIIIDEAHERSLNIDFILGYLRRLLPRRPDLKVIITSATIDTERFSAHFDDAPVIEVSGRSYPVEIRYRPLDDGDSDDRDEALDESDGIAVAVRELWREQTGDILVFCSGEREIRDAAEAVAGLKLPGAEVLPLFARLSAAEQQRVFRDHDKRRVVIATNVAETSVTVPGIRAVVDVGTARISRYSTRTKVQRLPIEKVSQASADQRAGRCGRIGPGICVRLYSEDDYDARPEFTEPEIQRTNLASVILQMASLRLGEIDEFGFVDPPDARAIKDGIDLLVELDALDPTKEGRRGWLTPIGRRLARLPIDPRYGRMLLEAARNECLDEVTIIVAGLSIQDPRERPSDKQQLADDAHRRFADPGSDFLAYLNLWDHVSTARRERSRNQFRRLCRREFLNYVRITEWQDIHAQLRRVARELDLADGGNRSGSDRRRRRHRRPTGADRDARRNRHRNHEEDVGFRDAIHRSVLVGLLSQIGHRDLKAEKRSRSDGGGPKGRRPRRRVEYLGARSTRFAIAPGSALTRESPEWVMAAELVETTRLWARTAAGIDPAWAEELGAHLATYSYGEPWWDADRGSALTKERVTLFGLTLAADRIVPLSQVDPRLARELFIHHALVEGEWSSDHAFVARNRELRAEIEAMEARTRRRDLLVEHRAIFDFYDQRLPDHVLSAAHFDSWWGSERRDDPALLDLTNDVLLAPDAEPIDPDAFPDSWFHGDLDLELVYEFDPASHLDGVSVLVPIDVVNQLDDGPFQWSVPGFRSELVASLIRSLPKAIRRQFVPATETVDEVLPVLDPSQGPLLDRLAEELSRRSGTTVRPDDFDLDRVPGHLRPTFRVINDDYELLAEGPSLATIKDELDREVRAAISTSVTPVDADWLRSGLRTWDIGTLPRVVETGPVKAYPALVDHGDSAAVELQATDADQQDAMWAGVRRLLRFQLSSPVRRLDGLLTERTRLSLVNGPVQSRTEWYNDAIDAALDAVIVDFGGPPWTEAGFDELVASGKAQFDSHLETVAAAIDELVPTLVTIGTRIDQLSGSETFELSLDDIRAHLARLAYPGFLAAVGVERLADIARYLEAIAIRLDGLTKNPVRDLETLAICRRLDNELAEAAATVGPTPEVEDAVWLLEELRVSLFAQGLRTAEKVSEKRVRRALNKLRS